MANSACIKNNIVENIIVLEENDSELIEKIKETFFYDELAFYDNDLNVKPGYLYDGTDFYREEGKKALRLDESDPDALPLEEESEQ